MFMIIYVNCYCKKGIDKESCIRNVIFAKGTFSNRVMICLVVFGLNLVVYCVNNLALLAIVSLYSMYTKQSIIEWAILYFTSFWKYFVIRNRVIINIFVVIMCWRDKLKEISHLDDIVCTVDEQKFAKTIRYCIIIHQMGLK